MGPIVVLVQTLDRAVIARPPGKTQVTALALLDGFLSAGIAGVGLVVPPVLF